LDGSLSLADQVDLPRPGGPDQLVVDLPGRSVVPEQAALTGDIRADRFHGPTRAVPVSQAQRLVMGSRMTLPGRGQTGKLFGEAAGGPGDPK